jgi:hypothetical protein
MQKEKVRTNLNTPRKITNTILIMVGNLSASWQYGNNLCSLTTSSCLLVCESLQSCVWGNEKLFQGFLR